MAADSRSPIRIGRFGVDPSSGDVQDGQRTTRLPPQAMAVLLALIEHPGRVVTRDELRKRLWPDATVDFEDGLNHAVSKLRETLHDPAHVSQLIETVPRRGYRFIGTVAESDNPNGLPHGEVAGARQQPPRVSAAWNRGRRTIWPATLVAIAAGVAGLWGVVAWRSGRAEAPIASVAVLPFADLSADASQAHLADGLAEELISELAKLETLRVISRTSTWRYRGTGKPLPQIARELEVEALVEGSVQRSGDRLIVAVHLVRARSPRHLWARTYDLRTGDVLSIRVDLARQIVGEMNRQVLSASAPGGRLPR